MSARACSKKTVVPVVVVMLLFATGCSQSPQSDGDVAPEVVVTELSHPDRQPTKADVDAGTACFQAPVSTVMWREMDRKYVGKNGWCEYEVK